MATNWEKEILYNGIPIEEVPMRMAAIHFDDEIVKDLCGAVMCQAIRDWHEMKEKGLIMMGDRNDEIVYRGELVRYFNGSFCGNILSLIFAPHVDIGTAVRNMDRYPVKKRQLGWGRGDAGDSVRRRWQKNGKNRSN